MQQRFLNQIFGKVQITANKPIEIAEQWGVMASHQRGQCHLVPCHHGCHQLFVAALLHRTRLFDSFRLVLFPVTSESHKRFARAGCVSLVEVLRWWPSPPRSGVITDFPAFSETRGFWQGNRRMHPQGDYDAPSMTRPGEQGKSPIILSEKGEQRRRSHLQLIY